jgi:HEPN domain-containing protein
MRKKLVDEWIYKAEEDFESARHLVKKLKRHVPDVVCFHCQ